MPSGVKIKEFRLKKNLTQKELAARCGMYESQIRKYELGTANPKIETLEKIATALEITVSELGVTDSERLKGIGNKLLTRDNPEFIEDLHLDFETKYKIGLISEKEYQKNKKEYEDYQKACSQESALLNAFHSLNVQGKDKAIEHTETLAKVPEYQQKKSNKKKKDIIFPRDPDDPFYDM